jgi:hypothetical protein
MEKGDRSLEDCRFAGDHNFGTAMPIISARVANRNLFRARNPVLGSWKSRTLPGHGEEMDLRSFFFDKIFGG